MKGGEIVGYLLLAALGLAALSRPASTAGIMMTGETGATNLAGVFTGQYLPPSGQKGNFSMPGLGGNTTFSLA